MRAVIAGSKGENMLKDIFHAQNDGFVQPVLVGDRARTMTILERLGLEREPFGMPRRRPSASSTAAAIS